MYAGLTVITCVPVYRALLRVANSIRYQPLSKMDRFSPALAAAPFGRNAPGRSGSGFALTPAVIFLVVSASNTTSSKPVARVWAVLAAKSSRRRRTLRTMSATRPAAFLRRADPFAVRAKSR